MNYSFYDFYYPSSDGKNKIYAEVYEPTQGQVRAVIQLAHGMVDYVGRYTEIADYMTGEGFVFAGNHHLGHGKTASSHEDLGFFANHGGEDYLLRDMYEMNRRLREKYPGVPLIVMGHSMGSFITRLYLERYPESLDAVIIHGTAGKNPLLPMGRFVTGFIRRFHNQHYRSRFVNSLALGAYNKAFPVTEGNRAWLSRDRALASRTDEYTDFIFSVSAYADLFKMLSECNSKRWYREYPKALPTLIVSGTDDPVGGKNAKGPREVYDGLSAEGCEALTLKLYEGARHELFKEINREEVFTDLTSWIESVILK